MSRAQVFPRDARSILTKTGGYLSGYTHTLQPYVGCEFACTYCYVRQLPVQRLNQYGLGWSEWISPKRNAAALLRRQGERGKLAAARIFCSSSTDPYTPLERKLGLTRACLEVLVEHPPGALVLQTRSPLVTRDADLIARIPSARVSISITTDDEAVRRRFEPNCPSNALRIEALSDLRMRGIPTQAAVSPLLPCDPERLARRLEPVADRVVIDDFFRGDGAGGSRSRRALEQLRERGHAEWAQPGYADAAVAVFERVFGAERVGVSQAGFNDLALPAVTTRATASRRRWCRP